MAALLGMMLAFALALVFAVGLGILAYALTKPSIAGMLQRPSRGPNPSERISTGFIFFSIYAFLYLMWATVPLSLGSGKQFDAGKLLLYPITLQKLFAVDLVSEITTIQSVFAIPAIVAMSVGAALGSGEWVPTLLAVLPISIFGLALSKWLATTIGSLFRRKRARGETIIALVGAIAGLGGALAGQIAPLIIKHAESFTFVRWTPPGAAAFLIDARFENDPIAYLGAFLLLSISATILVIGTYWIARRAALGYQGTSRRAAREKIQQTETYTGWKIPLFPDDLSAVFEKELRYAMRNAQLRTLAIMPLILIVIRLVNSKRFGRGFSSSTGTAATDFLTYGAGLMASGGVVYVFLLLAGLFCNQFAFEEAGMRTLILSPISRTRILIGKNASMITIALVYAAILLTINTLIFRDIDGPILLFVVLSFVCFAAITSILGNWFSISFPKRMQFGKRLNVSGVAGLLLIPMLLLLGVPPLVATLVGYITTSLLLEYATLAILALILIGSYFAVINAQGRMLARREIEILEAVKEPE